MTGYRLAGLALVAVLAAGCGGGTDDQWGSTLPQTGIGRTLAPADPGVSERAEAPAPQPPASVGPGDATVPSGVDTPAPLPPTQPAPPPVPPVDETESGEATWPAVLVLVAAAAAAGLLAVRSRRKARPGRRHGSAPPRLAAPRPDVPVATAPPASAAPAPAGGQYHAGGPFPVAPAPTTGPALDPLREGLLTVADRGASPGITEQIQRLVTAQPSRRQLIDASIRFRDQLRTKDPTSAAALLESLRDGGVHQLRSDGARFDPRVHEAVDTVVTADEYRHDHVAETLRPGYVDGDRTVRAAEVILFRYEPAGGDGERSQ